MKLLIITLTISLLPSLNGYSCCALDSRNFTQMLLERTEIIYYMEVIESFNDNGKCSAKIIIIESFFGEPSNDTIVIQTGQVNTPTTMNSVTGQHLNVGSKWLVYDGFTCNKFTKNVSKSKDLYEELNIVRTFNQIITKRETKNIELFYGDGNLAVQGTFKKGIPHGNWKHFFKNGTLKIEENYIEGISSGIYKEFDTNNKIIKHCEFLKSTMQCDTYSHIITYFSNNKIKEEYTLKNNSSVDGKWITYHYNGKIKSIQIYKDNKPYGVWLSYSKTGEIIEKIIK